MLSSGEPSDERTPFLKPHAHRASNDDEPRSSGHALEGISCSAALWPQVDSPTATPLGLQPGEPSLPFQSSDHKGLEGPSETEALDTSPFLGGVTSRMFWLIFGGILAQYFVRAP